MPSFKLDGREIAFEPGETIIKAAWRAGVEIPHYCWHPGLSVAANCRMCLVEIKTDRPGPMMPIVAWDAAAKAYVPAVKPKLQPACQTPAVDGQEVFAASAEVKKAQSSVQEFLLLNHPVDCPICDQAGECKLQDYFDEHQHQLKRKRTEPVHKVKAERFGETIVYDGERCVMCTRCIRFCNEVAQDPVLDMRERGNKNEITLAPGRTLDHKYTLMTEHVCPVGALTSRDFRFKARVWFLKSQPSVCGGCATGCNMLVDYDPRHNQVYRLRPRDNAGVNQFWMCDDGMMSYQRYGQERVLFGRVRAANGKTSDCEVGDAFEAAAKALKGIDGNSIAVVFSAQHSNEDNWALAKLAEKLGASRRYLAALGGWDGDTILRDNDNNPNRAGAELVAGGKLAPLAEAARDVESGAVKAVIALGGISAESDEQLAALARVPVVLFTTHEGVVTRRAAVVIPVAVHVETFGTFVNAQGLAQQFKRAVFPAEGVTPAWEAIGRLAEELGKGLSLKTLNEVRAALPAPKAVAMEAQA